MSLLPRFALNRHRAQEKALEQQVTALRSALDQCKGMAKRWTEARLEVMAIIAVVFMGLGFALGVYREPLQRSAGAALATVGIGSSRPDFKTVNAVFQKGEYPAALRLAQPLADEGDARAQSIVAQIDYRGRGVPQSDTEAATWFRRAADQGDALAQFYLGVMYNEGRGEWVRQNRLDRTHCFFKSGLGFLPSFLVMNLLTLFFSVAGCVSLLLILRSFLRSIFAGAEITSHILILWAYPLGMAVISLIATTSQQFLKLSKLFLTRYQCSLWSAWKQSAEFFFVNLRPMGGISSLLRMLQCLFAIMAVTFLAQLTFVLGPQFLGLLLSIAFVVCLGYSVLRNYLYLIQSGSLLALINQ